jgi:hypothetical protein
MLGRRLHLVPALVAIVLAAALPVGGAAAPGNDVLVALEPGIAGTRLIERQGGILVSKPLRIWKLGTGAAARAVPALRRLGLLRYAEPDRMRTATAASGSDPLAPEAWYLNRIGADRASQPGPGVPITILDGGVLLDYEELRARADLVALNDQPTVANSVTAHGTILAAIAGAPVNGVGTVGVYPRSALRTFTLAGFDDSSLIAGLDAVTAAGPSVINFSIGGPGFSLALYEAVLRAVNGGSIVVASAGNSPSGTAPDFFPADYPHVLTVGSTARDDSPSAFSIRSPAVDLAAPGEEITVLDPIQPGQTTVVRGTSYATPIVSAAAALLWTARPELDATQVTELLRRTADDVGPAGFDPKTGMGVPDVPAALARATPVADPLEPNDDVDMVVGGGIFPVEKPAVDGSVRARLDESEDPRDVYRLVVPARGTVTLTLKAGANLGLSLWRSGTESVLGPVTGHRLASSNRKCKAVERLTWRNRLGADTEVYVDVWISKRPGTQRAGYTLSIG